VPAQTKRKPGRDAEGLTPRQALFVLLLLGDSEANASRAYVGAGFSPRGAAQSASALLRNPNIQEALARRRAKTAAKLEVTKEKLLRRLLDISDLDLADLLTDKGSLRPVKDWPEALRRSVQGLEVVEQGGDDNGLVYKVKLGDRGQNLERVAKMLGFIVERSQSTNLDVAAQLKGKYTADELIAILERLLGRDPGGKK